MLAPTLPPPSESAYYLVVPRNAHFEGSYGVDGSGAERAPAAGACLAQETGACP